MGLDAVTLPAPGRRRIRETRLDNLSGIRIKVFGQAENAGDAAGLFQQAHRRAEKVSGNIYISDNLREIYRNIEAIPVRVVDQVIEWP